MGGLFRSEALLLSFSFLGSAFAYVSSPLVRRTTTPNYSALNLTLNGTLGIGTPMALPCYSNYNGASVSVNTAACSNVQTNYLNELFIASNFGGYENSNWGICQNTAQGCNLNFSNPTAPLPVGSECYQGNVPSYYVPVTNVSSVQAALSFAKTNGVPVVIKNSGHDYKGRSAGAGTLAIWMNTYKPPITLTQSFIPDGCPAAVGTGVTVGGGHDFDEVYQFAEANNVTIVGGSSRSVGAAGGWLTGGGHGALSNYFGLGVDNALQIRAVLANGTYVTANRCQNSDLFFALRGGGGNSFGVNMEVTYRAHPQVTVQVAYVAFVATNLTTFGQFVSILTANANTWAQEGWGGYISLGGEVRTLFGIIMMNPNMTNAQAAASMAPVINFANSGASAETLVANVFESGSFYQAYQAFIEPNEEQVDIGVALSSRLIPSSLLSTKIGQEVMSLALSSIANLITYPTSPFQKDPFSVTYGAPLQLLLTTPYNYQFPAGESASDSSVTPAWRGATWHVALGQSFANDANANTIREAFAVASGAADILRLLTPTSGAYINEADVFEPDPIDSYWGQANYAKLQTLKTKYDPTNLLTCWGCIGWNPSDPRYGCYPNLLGLLK